MCARIVKVKDIAVRELSVKKGRRKVESNIFDKLLQNKEDLNQMFLFVLGRVSNFGSNLCLPRIFHQQAHKMILAMVSQPFRNMFFVHNTVDMSANKTMMEDTTKPPFQMMIDAVYNVKPMKKSLQGKSIHEMFAVLYLVTKYEISELELAVEECLASFPISEDNALEVADDAMKYSTTFGEAAQSLLLACAKFLKSNFMTDNEYFVRLVAENGSRMATVQKLAVLIKDLAPPPGPPTCSGCKKISTECLNGQGVTNRNVEIGIKVVLNRSNRSFTGLLVKKDERNDSWVVRWGEEEDGGWPLVDARGTCLFLFKCP